MLRVDKLISMPLFDRISGFLLGICWAVFAWVNMKAYFSTGQLAFLVFCITESLQALFFVIRKEPKTISTDKFAWAAALAGTFAVLCLRPGGAVIWEGGSTLIIGAFVIQILALLSLNTSFAIAPANRGIKTAFLYSLVRHPIYATYLLSTVGYLLFNATYFNALCVLFFAVLTIIRIRAEETHLLHDESYRSYVKKVPYRIFPYIY